VLSDATIGILQLVLFIFFIMLGFPIAFTLMAMGLFFGYFAMQDRVFDLLVQRAYAVMSNDVLISVPLFVSWATSSSGQISWTGSSARCNWPQASCRFRWPSRPW